MDEHVWTVKRSAVHRGDRQAWALGSPRSSSQAEGCSASARWCCATQSAPPARCWRT